MRKVYEPPKAEIEKFTIVSVITTSPIDPGPGEGSGNEGDTEF